MVFSSNLFLFCFLPIVLALYYAVPAAQRNWVLFSVSVAFYAFDAGWLTWLLLMSIAMNYARARLIAALSGGQRQLALAVVLILNLWFLLYYKYATFLWSSLSALVHGAGIALPKAPDIPLPIGISFFTFQAISYVMDVYSGRVFPARRLLDFGMYHSLFPQLIAGPIIRYSEIESQIYRRPLTIDRISDGIFRFCLGFGKKLILADTNGRVADSIFSLPPDERTMSIAWLGLLAYTLQIYFDFSAYSDMAIGLGKLLGFDFPENFNAPYSSQSITEFWRRWHMTLSRWLRDYLYIPLGGSRHGEFATCRNIMIVFFLCGLWHGAGVTFILWGLWQGFWLVVERLYRDFRGDLPRNPLMWASTLLITMLGWTIFRAATMTEAGHYFSALFGLNHVGTVYYGLAYFATPYNLLFLGLGLLISLGPFQRLSPTLGGAPIPVFLKGSAALAVFVIATIMLAANSFNPFIYFRF